MESLQKRQADFTDLYNRLLRDRRNSMLRRYSPEKKKEVQEFLLNLRPPYFFFHYWRKLRTACTMSIEVILPRITSKGLKMC